MPVEIKIYGETAAQTLFELSELATYLAPPQVSRGEPMVKADWPDAKTAEAMVHDVMSAAAEWAPMTATEVAERAAQEVQTAAARERGQPSPGKARRTKAEIAEDEAADKADAGNIVDESGETSDMSIATGEERISPEDEADAAVDAADEAAETEATGGLVPRERLRKALGALGIKAGVEAVKPGGLLGMAVQDVPEDQIEAAIAKLEAAKQVNFVNTGKSEPTVFEVEKTPATKDELMAAMLDYAEIFDGTRDPKKAVLASEDCGKVFKLIFGDEVASMSKVPADQYDKAIAGIREAIAKNPFKREKK